MNRPSLILSSVAIVSLSSGCMEPIESPHAFGATDQPIYFGSPDTSAARMAVVALTSGYSYFCSGTLITDTIVLTAAHCLDAGSPSNTQIFFGQNANTGSGDTRGIAEWLMHPDYNAWGGMDGDIGIIRLSSPAPTGVTPIPYLPESIGLTTADVGEEIDFSGFGVTETGSGGVKLHVTGSIGLVCSGPNACSGGEVAPRAFQYEQAGGGPCSGDSGGPAFIVRGGHEYVAGITSYGDRDCAYYGVSSTVSAYTSWIETFLSVGGDEDCTNQIDDDDDGAIDCADGDCSYHIDCQGPNACQSPTPVTCGDRIDGTTAGGYSVFRGNGCASSASSSWDGPEVAYEINVGQGTQVTTRLQMTGSGDLDLLLLPGVDGVCDVDDCVDASMEPGRSSEIISLTMPSAKRYILIETWDTPSTYTLTIECAGNGVEDCDNQYDDDGDGDVDCADNDCVGDVACNVTPDGGGGSGGAPAPIPYTSGGHADGGGCNGSGLPTGSLPATLGVALIALRRRRIKGDRHL